ncbi:unnamed protein product [Penicillium roqueforti FM164]|uniref:Genomic scaffold, ProqFM164S01 n=1 Tax=Penicillium roqueforti (strain FM164) TaxID=1365484 RepID=W6PVS5_PENRF|nr:unnamed protein product [Penicillium roqueforti FM164]
MQQCDRTTIRVTLTLPVRHTVFFPTSCTEEYNGVTFKKDSYVAWEERRSRSHS